jgi:hypothetical protein
VSLYSDLVNTLADLEREANRRALIEWTPRTEGGGQPHQLTPYSETAIGCDVGSIRSRLLPYVRPSAAACVRIQEHLEGARSRITENQLAPLVGSQSLLGNWSGTARDHFHDFLQQAITAQANQPRYIDEIISLVVAYRELIKSARKDAQRVADAGLAAMRDQGDDRGLGDILSGMVDLATTVVDLVQNPPKGLWQTGRTFYDGFNRLSRSWSALKGAGVHGETVPEILDSVYWAAGKLDEAVTERADTLDELASDLLDELSGDRLNTISPRTMPELGDPARFSYDQFIPTRRPG